MKPYQNAKLIRVGRIHKIAAEMTTSRFSVHVELPEGAFVADGKLTMPADKQKTWEELGLWPSA